MSAGWETDPPISLTANSSGGSSVECLSAIK
jgi:hypothetical protein